MLRDRQRRFVDEYLVDLNATAAYIRAGYKGRGAAVCAAKLLRNANIQAAISARQQSLSERTQIKQENVLAELASVAFSDIGQILDFSGDVLCLRKPKDIPESARRAIQSIKVRRQVVGRGEDAVEVEWSEFRLWSKSDALEKIGQHLGLWKELDIERVIEQIPDSAKRDELRAALGIAVAEVGGQGSRQPQAAIRSVPTQPDPVQPGRSQSPVVGEAAGDSPTAP